MKFLHITDLHFCPGKDGEDSVDIRESLISFIRESRMEPDEIFLTGDYRHAGLQKKESEEASANQALGLIRDIADAAGIRDTGHIHLAPGNHDRKRVKNKNYAQLFHNYQESNGSFSDRDWDALKHVLREIDEKYPGLSIIVLAHHSADLFGYRRETCGGKYIQGCPC